MVEGICKHSETLEDMVRYRALYVDEKFGNYAEWVRPLSMFIDEIQMDKFTVSRFTKLSKEESNEVIKEEMLKFMIKGI